MKNFKRIMAMVLVIVIMVPSFAMAAEGNYGTAKNVIMMIPDGMNIEASTMARWMTDDFTLVMDSMATGLVKTNNSNTPIADSAPAGTAMATGYKTQSPYVGTYPSQGGMPGAVYDSAKAMMPIATIVEGAERAGKATGIISTSNVQHATPADYTSHNPNRNNYEDLAEQQVYQGMEVVLGAGSKHLDPAVRKDGEDLIGVIKELGYDYVTTPEAMKSSTGNKLWGMFAESAMAYDIDRDPAVEPSLAEMTEKALEVLAKNEKGFFLMVEGSKVDWAAHANDPVGVNSDVLAFDAAVKVAKDFADKHGDTVLVIASDHGTGGLTIGHRQITSGYDKAPLESFTHIIKGAKLTGEGVAAKLDENKTNIPAVMEEAYGIKDLSEAELNSIKEAKDVQAAVGTVVSNRSNIGWTTGGHVGGDVALYCYSTASDAKLLSGTVHNNDIGKYVKGLLGLDLDSLTTELYNVARPGFEAKGATIEFNYSEDTNHEVKVVKGDQEILLPISKNYAIVNGEKVDIGGLTIFNTKTIYVPQAAFELVK